MTAPVQVGPSPSGGGPVPSHLKSATTLEQMLVLVARAERKGGLDYMEGQRLRAGIQLLSDNASSSYSAVLDAQADLRRRYKNQRHRAWAWRRRATAAGAAPVSGGTVKPAATVDRHAADALKRVTDMATRWTHISAKRQAGLAVLAAISGRQS